MPGIALRAVELGTSTMALAVALLLAGCEGVLFGPGAGPRRGDPPPPGATTSPSDLRRLTHGEYENTVRALFGDAGAMAAQGALDLLPVDRRAEGFSSMARGVTTAHVSAHFEVAERIATEVAADPAQRGALEPCLAETTDDVACIDRFIRSFGLRAYRRPLTDADASSLRTLYDETRAEDGSEAGLESVIMAMILSPEFTYRVELGEGTGGGAGDVVRLTEWELASRLSYLTWGAPPDDALLEAAETGQLSDATGFRAELERLFADPRAEAWVGAFFEEWLHYGTLPAPTTNETFLDGIDATRLPDAMEQELALFVQHVVFEQHGGLEEIFTSRETFITSPALATIYGVDAPVSTDVPAMLGEERAGILTRAGLLVSTGLTTQPILRGAAALRRFTCLELAPPDPASLPRGEEITPPAFDPTLTSRERWTARTSGTVCSGCHSLINPVGFALEHFDSVGRHRSAEAIWMGSTIVGELPIDTAVEVQLGAQRTAVDGALELGQALAASEATRSCFSRQWFRYAFGRRESERDDAVLDAMRASLVEEGLLRMLMRIATTEDFGQKRVPE